MYQMTGKELFESGKRFAVTMFEYSWMVQRTGLQAEYADWDKVLDEVVERGYDCIRIDAFPHVLKKDADGNRPAEVTFQPIPADFMWGNHAEVTVNVAEGLVEFVQKAKDRGIYIGLSSWYNNTVCDRKSLMKTPEDYISAWTDVLDLLAENDLLDGIVWVDVCNEFPLNHWAPHAYSYIAEEPVGTPMDAKALEHLESDWDEEYVARMNEYLVGVPKKLKVKYPQFKYAFSNQCYGEDNFLKGDFSELDMVDPHIWATDDMATAMEIGFFETLEPNQFPVGVANMRKKAEAAVKEDVDVFTDILDERTEKWADAAKERNVELVTTEAWCCVAYEDLSQNGHLGEWDWVKAVLETGVDFAIDRGWKGICTSNFAEPHFEGMWQDVEWHKRMTDRIRNGK
ncbi:cellulase-like family protein [Vibrio cortegadensis]|uniref:cellulase-like family protein n=1 Tax=Vibrio cortegadensis TaxID=1328770 RepID=UPI0021C31EF1|nr:cellulase-like family protein [Vibrio cortegadensis]MDN3697504.1 cellulase-like family protein [Vibrio cortegadensis]